MTGVVLLVEETPVDQDQVAYLPVLGRDAKHENVFHHAIPEADAGSCMRSMGEE
jgi:hypothetical protein